MSTPIGQAFWANESWQLPTATKLTVFFQKLPVKNETASEKAGYDVFEEKVHIVKLPADPTLRVCRIPTVEDKKEYKALYKEFMDTQKTRIPGIPIESWPHITETQKLNFKAMGILTVEQFANYPDGPGQSIMGFHELRKKAQEFIRVGASQDLIAQIKAEANAEVAAMKKQMEEMRAMLEEMTSPKDAA